MFSFRRIVYSLTLLAGTLVHAQTPLDLTQTSLELCGNWELELLGRDQPWKEHYSFEGDSVEQYRVQFTADRKYSVEMQYPHGIETVDQGSWEIWYLTEGFYGDTLFYAKEGLYLILHPDGETNHFPLFGEYPELLVFSDPDHFSLHWECFCGLVSIDRGFRRKGNL